MLNSLVKLPALFFLFAAGCAATPEGDVVKHLAIHVGERHLDDDWVADSQPTTGVQLDWRAPEAPIGYEVALFVSSEDEDPVQTEDAGPLVDARSVSASTADLAVGVRKTFEQFGKSACTYVGAGFALTHAELEAEDADGEPLEGNESDTSLGVYAHVGVCWSVLTSSIVGVDYRLLAATDVELLDSVEDADSGLFSVFVGFTF